MSALNQCDTSHTQFNNFLNLEEMFFYANMLEYAPIYWGKVYNLTKIQGKNLFNDLIVLGLCSGQILKDAHRDATLTLKDTVTQTFQADFSNWNPLQK